MDEWLKQQMAAGFPAFAGSEVTGTIAVRQDLLNEWLARWMSEAGAGRHAASDVDPAALLRFVRRVSVRAEPETLLVDFSVVI